MIEGLIVELPADTRAIDHRTGADAPGASTGTDITPDPNTGGAKPILVDPAIVAECVISTVEHLTEFLSIRVSSAQNILTEVETDMNRLTRRERLVSWVKAMLTDNFVRAG